MDKIEARAQAYERTEMLADGEESAALVAARRKKLEEDKVGIATALGIDPNMSAAEIDQYINDNIAKARAEFAKLPKWARDSIREAFEAKIAEWDRLCSRAV